MTILALAAQADLLAPVVLRARLGPVVPRPGRAVPRVAGAEAVGPVGPVRPVEQQAQQVQQVQRVQLARVSVAVQWMRVPTRPTHPTLLSELDINTGFAADGGPKPAQVNRSALRSGCVSGQGVSSHTCARLNIWKCLGNNEASS